LGLKSHRNDGDIRDSAASCSVLGRMLVPQAQQEALIEIPSQIGKPRALAFPSNRASCVWLNQPLRQQKQRPKPSLAVIANPLNFA
jgi:hypothetical protein